MARLDYCAHATRAAEPAAGSESESEWSRMLDRGSMPQQCACRCRSPPASVPPSVCAAARAASRPRCHLLNALHAYTCDRMCLGSNVHICICISIYVRVCAYVLMLDVACAFVWTLGGRTSNPSKGVASLERPSVPVYLSRWPVPELGQYYQRSLPAVARSGMCPARSRAHVQRRALQRACRRYIKYGTLVPGVP